MCSDCAHAAFPYVTEILRKRESAGRFSPCQLRLGCFYFHCFFSPSDEIAPPLALSTPRKIIAKTRQNGANVHERDEKFHNWTALHFAADRGHADVVDTLLYYGAHIGTYMYFYVYM